MFLLDTNDIFELRRPHKANSAVVSWAGAIPAASVFLSAISILEIELGALLIARPGAAQGAVLRRWIGDQLLPRFEARIFAVDTAVAQRCGRLPVPDPRAERDALMAATVMVHGSSRAMSPPSSRPVSLCSIRGCSDRRLSTPSPPTRPCWASATASRPWRSSSAARSRRATTASGSSAADPKAASE